MSSFVDQDFLLNTRVARELYHDVAKNLPIIDYHSHLQQGEIAGRKTFRNLAELWLGGDHYKWRLMRSSGVSEHFITGQASDKDKFRAFCKVLPLAIGNPIHHWSHLELRRLFDIRLNINETNADAIWDAANTCLSGMDTWAFLEQAGVEIACTTDDPVDDLMQHEEIARSALKTRVLPAYRPDRAMRINRDDFPAYLDDLARASDVDINSFTAMITALDKRVTYFHEHGARISDHAVDTPLPAIQPSIGQLEALFAKRLRGERLDEAELGQYLSGLLREVGKVYARKDWAMCLHIGAQRNNNTRMLQKLGTDTGYDSISDLTTSTGLSALLDSLDADELLPRTVLFGLNPAMNEMLSTMIGNFQDGRVVGKIQFGPAWWFNDHKEGNLQQMISLANHGVLGTFVGMVTDSRSFASYPRHDYFRRLLCRLLGLWVEGGEYPDDRDSLTAIVRAISYGNAKSYFKL